MFKSFKEFELDGWERVARAYHDHFGQFTSKIATNLVNKAAIQQGDQVLDIACGPGYTAALAQKAGADVMGIDFSEAMIHQAQNLHPNIKFEAMDAEELRLLDACFDHVLINFGILHFANPKQVMQEAFRVLKPGGKLLFTVWDKPTPFDLIFDAVQAEGNLAVSLPEGPDFFQYTDPKASKEILLQLGFHTAEAIQIEYIWKLNSAVEFFQAFYQSGVRIGGILRAQEPSQIQKITDYLETKMRIFERHGKLEVPVPVLIFKAFKV